MDAFGSLFTVPFQLTTVEAVRHVHGVLKDDGVVIFNIGSAVSSDSSQFLKAVLATYRQVFPAVHIYKVDMNADNERLQNLMIVAVKKLETEPVFEIEQKNASLLAHRYSDPINIDRPVITDDLAPVERYLSIAHAAASNK